MSTTNELPSRVALGAAVGVTVAVVAAVSDVGVGLLVVATIAAVATFWLLDTLLSSGRTATATEAGDVGAVSGTTLPLTASESLAPPRGVEAPTITEPGAVAAVPVEEQHNARLDPALFDPDSVEIKTSSQSSGRVFSIRVAKHGNTIGECEDAVTIDPRRGVLAVSDGASSSFGAHLWSATLAKSFVKQPPKPLSIASFALWLDEARRTSRPDGSEDPGKERDAGNGWWSERGARNGAFATIVGAAIMNDGDARVATVMCLGDSCAFVLTGAPGERTVRRSLPYEDASQFGSHPALLGSIGDRAHDEPSWTTIPAAPGDLLVLASDAVAEWLLGDPKRFQLFDGHEPDAIASRLIGERTDGRLVNDDLGIALMELSG